MIYLDDKTDSILPYGLKLTPFEVVYKALQAVASTVWPVDAADLRAAVGWGWYLVNAPGKLAEASAGRVFVQNVLISEGAPLVKATQTQAELVDLLARWRAYRPTFDALEGLYLPYAATVDVRPITDAATQALLPVTDIHGAFYVVITDVDWSRPLTLDEAVLIAERATPMGSHPIALYGFEELTPVTATAANGDAWVFVDSVEIAQEPPAPPVVAVPLCGSMGADYSESVMATLSERMERGGIGFTGSLRENIIPESGVVDEYVAPSMYDVWIESVDAANNVVIALRSVFTGLTATRANTIVNNAPIYLSRYNSYLNNQGGPYIQSDAIAMRDNLQSRIPAGDTSTFGIRPAST